MYIGMKVETKCNVREKYLAHPRKRAGAAITVGRLRAFSPLV